MLQKRIVQQLLQKHLHIRGENLLLTARKQGVLETPPHTWRKLNVLSLSRMNLRNTSTYVEKIRTGGYMSVKIQKHLHIRGENLRCCTIPLQEWETPPHTWRKFVCLHRQSP